MKNIFLIFVLLSSLIQTTRSGELYLNEDKIKPYFSDYPKSCFALYDFKHDQSYFFNKTHCQKRLSPCSTFKVYNAMIGLESGSVTPNTLYSPESNANFPLKIWYEDHTLATAIEHSVVWYFQRMARNIGPKTMQQYIEALNFGNQDISSAIDNFWLYPQSLKISAEEQLELVKQLYQNNLPFKRLTMNQVKAMLILEKYGNNYQFSGKTGSGMKDNQWALGWFIGHLKTRDNQYVFVTNIEEGPKAYGPNARDITKQVLTELGLIDTGRWYSAK